MEKRELQTALLRCVSAGNLFDSDMLHTSKDFAKCRNLMLERKPLYCQRMVRIDLSALSQDLYIDLSILASYKVLISLRRVFVGVLGFVGKSGMMYRRVYLCCFFLVGVCVARFFIAGCHFYNSKMRPVITYK